MGIIRVALDSIKGTLADQYLESVVPYRQDPQTIMTPGVVEATGKPTKNRGNRVITDGSLVQVGEGQTMLLVDGGKIIDYTAEAGYFEVRNTSAPSMLNGQFGDTLSDAFERFRFGGATPRSQEVYYVNIREIRDVPFGTQNPINYFDSFYNAELYVRAHGYYSVRVVNPIKFFVEMGRRDNGVVTIEDLQRSLLSEFLTAFQTAIGTMSVQGDRISHLTAKATDLSQHMRDVLDADWEELRGIRIESVGISSISYDEQSRKLIDMRNQGAMLGDPTVQQGYVAGATARGIEAAGSNPSGAGMGAIGMGMMGRAAEEIFPRQQGQPQAQQTQQTPQQPQPQETWLCPNCGNQATGNFCSNCGAGKPAVPTACPTCNAPIEPGAKFCNQCGTRLD